MQRRPHLLWGVVLFAAGLTVGGLGVYTWDHRPGSPARRWEATVYLPTQDENGQAFSEQRWHEAVSVLVHAAGGATIGLEGHQGLWKDDADKITREPVRPVIVSFPRANLSAFRQAVREVGQKLGQRMVYVRYEEPRVEFLPGIE